MAEPISLGRLPDALPAVAMDTTLLEGASSYIEPYQGRADPRADRAFRAAITAFCNDVELFLPLPGAELYEAPLLLRGWQSYGIRELSDLEMSDQEFDAIASQVAHSFALFAEGSPFEVARWIAFQFTPGAQREYTGRAAMRSLQRTAGVVGELLESGRLSRTRQAIFELQRAGEFDVPELYEDALRADLPSAIHIALAYAVAICARGWSYAEAISKHAAAPVYRHAWIRTPALRLHQRATATDELAVYDWFPWGDILAAVFDPVSPLADRTATRVMDVLCAVRENAARVRGTLPYLFDTRRSASTLTDAEMVVIDVLRTARIAPMYRSTTRAETLAQWLREIFAEAKPTIRLPVETVSGAVQLEAARRAEMTLRVRFRRDTFWDVFDDPGVRQAVNSFGLKNDILLKR